MKQLSRLLTEIRTSVAVALAAAAVLAAAVLAAAVPVPVGAAIDPDASAKLAGELKTQMQLKLKKLVPGLVITKVTCYVPATSKLVSGKCTARFTIAKYRVTGVYQAHATKNAESRLSWSTSAVSCADAKTHKPVKC